VFFAYIFIKIIIFLKKKIIFNIITSKQSKNIKKKNLKQNKIQNFSFFLLLNFFFSFQICSFYVWLNWNWTLWFASIRFTLDFLSVGKTIGARLMLYLGKTKSISLIGNNKSFKDEFETCQFRD
jgi:hypothetical protein